MSQLLALVWLKWALFRNSMRSRRAAAGHLAAALGALAGLALSLFVAAGVGAGAYLLSAGGGGAVASQARAGFVVLLFVFTLAFVTCALTPLALGGGESLRPSRMLVYPVCVGECFAFDFLSDLTSLTSIFVIPSLVAAGAGVGLGRGRLAAGLAVSACAVAFGLSFAKLLSVGVGALTRARRTRGETALALLGAGVGLAGMLAGQLLPALQSYAAHLEAARWTPPGAAAHALARGVFAGDDGAFAVSTLTLAAYAMACALLAYRVARRTALGEGGGARRATPAAGGDARAAGAYAGWQLPLVSPQFSALLEKELRYAVRNAQLRVVALLAVGLTIILRAGPVGAGPGRAWGAMTPYAEGAGAVFSVLYILMLVSPLATNLFGYDGAGMRALVLSPASRRTVLVAKNAAVTLVALVLAAAGVGAGGLVFGDLTPRALLFAALAFATAAPLFALCGNWLSLRFPKRVEFGKRMNRSGVAGLLLVPLFLLLLLPPCAAVAAAHFAASPDLKYVILAAFALLAAICYALVVARQGRSLERRELEVLEAVTGRSDGGDGHITG